MGSLQPAVVDNCQAEEGNPLPEEGTLQLGEDMPQAGVGRHRAVEGKPRVGEGSHRLVEGSLRPEGGIQDSSWFYT